MSLIYWDTMLFVYGIEGNPEFQDRTNAIFARMQERGDQLCTSAFTVGELLTGPYQKNDAALAAAIRDAIRVPFVKVLPFDNGTANRYALIRASHRVSPADTIQLAPRPESTSS